MSLFQTSVLKNYINLQETALVEKAYKKYAKYFLNPTIQENIRSSKEEEYQGIFLTELFVNILDYTLKPKANFNLVAEYKNQNNARKADGAILQNDVALAVIELKGTNTKDLESIRKQAFDYKANQKGCVYVITSNFEKLRFYINDATEFLEFNLFELTKERFQLFYLCLHKDNILTNVALKIKEASIVQEEKITKDFYKDYSLFKRELYRDLVKQNMTRGLTRDLSPLHKNESLLHNSESPLLHQEKTTKLALFKKSQKLIDRFLFIFFAEDRSLLPANSTELILQKWKADIDFGDDRPLYNLFKQYFHFLDQGRKGTKSRGEIYAYNGGLFKPDALLDSLTINSDLLYKHTHKLAGYDFESQVDVNILGHIFENSLNEIESVNAEIEGADFDKQKSKRKKDGVFYTPKYITKYIVENTVGKLCEEKKAELGIKEEEYFKGRKNRKSETIKNLVALLDAYRTWLLQLTICDPACGSGAFLNQALNFLIAEHTYIDELKTKVLGGGLQFSDIENTILENNIFGVDLNEESVEIAKLSLWLRTAQPRRKLNDLSSNIKCGNSLIDSKTVAGDKAFHWETQFPNVFKEKNKKPYHITTAIHDSRTSTRMEKYKVRERREMGTNPYPNVIYFTPEDDANISKTIAEIVQEDNLNLLAYNICADHIHLLLVCELEEIPAIMQKIKGRTSYNNKRDNKGNNKGLKPLAKKEKEKENNKPLWQQKYSAPKEITSEEQLYNTVKYIQTNRAKHELPAHKKATQQIIDAMCCTKAKAFKTEYTGGFDVIIGNPPYVQVNKDKVFYDKKYQTSKCGDLYAFFYEKGIEILKAKGIFSYITPSLFIKGLRYESLREFLLENTNIIEISDKGDGVFQDVQMPTAILIAEKSMNNNQIWDNFIPNGILINKIQKDSIYLSDLTKIKRGLEIGKDKVLEFDLSNIKIITGEDVARYLIKNYKSISKETYGKYKKDNSFFDNERIVIRETGNRITSFYVSEKLQQNRSLYSILLCKDNFDYKYLLGLINSSLMQFYYKNKYAANTNVFPKIRIAQVKNLPIKNIIHTKQIPFIDKVDIMLSITKNFQKIVLKLQTYLKQKFQLEKLSKKLQNWHELEFGDFIKELNKAIKVSNKNCKGLKPLVKPLAKKDEFEWLELFEENKQKAQALQIQINQTDAAIDKMVYELYGLTEEEIAIVEAS
ncbi:TaqI-like C-terminal specificity domain-containing protein [uncultured Polaribacter sp.]|uniref:Eco57I restriction-modification methylase domain-containing protein n=1 Tax=uncultured Polaribacter sp. TaxID=174711 RepID=UPI00262B09CC|nr:TaqI-like C-terminal specificity domain-containing protein [uncultured Polaribacter sp.]